MHASNGAHHHHVYMRQTEAPGLTCSTPCMSEVAASGHLSRHVSGITHMVAHACLSPFCLKHKLGLNVSLPLLPGAGHNGLGVLVTLGVLVPRYQSVDTTFKRSKRARVNTDVKTTLGPITKHSIHTPIPSHLFTVHLPAYVSCLQGLAGRAC